MLKVTQLACARGEQVLFREVGFCLEGGEMLAVLGNNGSGKTSLLRILSGLSLPVSGEVFWRGDLIGKQAENYRRELCYLGHANAVKEELTPLENLRVSARLVDKELDEKTALRALESIGLAGKEYLACRTLSQGQKRLVALARLVNERCALWILDEPFEALDAVAVNRVTGLIGTHLLQGGLVVMATHQVLDVVDATVRELQLD